MKLKSLVKLLVLPVTLIAISAPWVKAEELPEVYPLANAGFENGLTGWDVRSEFENNIKIVDDLAHSGHRAVKIDSVNNPRMPFVVGAAQNLTGGAIYELSAWARLAPGSSETTAALKLEEYNAAGENTGGVYGTEKLPADGAWKKVVVRQRLNGDTVRASLLVRLFSGEGAVIFDDVAFEKVGHAPDITIAGPRQLAKEPGQDFQETYTLMLRQPWNEAELPPVTATLKALDEPDTPPQLRDIPAQVARGDNDRQLKVTLTVPALEPGSYAIQFRSHKDGGPLESVYPAYIFTLLKDRKPGMLSDDGVFLRNGKPFFPIGMYHPSAEDYPLLAEYGFNAVQGDPTHDLNRLQSSLDLARQYGLAVDVPLYLNLQVENNLPHSLEKVRRFADHPAVLNWKIFDEPHIEADGGVAVGIPAVYRTLKAANSNQPIELTLNSVATQQFWSQFCDIVQPDSYPLPRFPLTTVSDMATNAKKFMQPWQNMSFVLQCGWVSDLSNQPSPEQARSMVYLAVIHGAKGIWWYSMRETTGWDLTKTPLWPHLKTINAELQQLSQPLLSGESVPVDISNAQVHASAKKYQGKLYLLITNPGNAEEEVTLNFAAPLKTGEGTFLNGHQTIKSKMTANGTNSVTLKLNSLQSETVVFDLP